MNEAQKQQASLAFKFVLLIGVVNLFADMTYEGGASINGQFMALLGASALVVSVTSGLGEFLGYALRIFSGRFADRSGRYWPVTFIGYVINLCAVPAMFFAGSWQVAALLILAERAGRALRKPPVEAMLSYATGTLGRGWVYALNTTLDEIGAALGPLVVAAVLFLGGDYKTGYAALSLSVILTLGSLAMARISFPVPSKLARDSLANRGGFSRPFWLSMLAGACFATGFVSYELVPFHLAATGIVAPHWIPVLLSFSIGCGVAANLVLGKLFDRAALPTIVVAIVLSSTFAPLVFLAGHVGVMLGMIAWGISYAVEDTLLSAVVAGFLPDGKRGFAFGLFFAGYGGGMLLGSVVMGLLYGRSLLLMAGFSTMLQLASLPMFFAAYRARTAPVRIG